MASETPAEHMLRSIRITGAARFHASARLRHHETASLWTISFASLILLLMPVLSCSGFEFRVNVSVIAFSQIGASAAILVMSILLTGFKFGERAEKMHRCALALNGLCRRLEVIVAAGTDQVQVDQVAKDYESVLAEHENHAELDYQFAKIQKMPEFYRINWRHKLRANLRYMWEFLRYGALFFLLAWLLFAAITGRSGVGPTT